MGKKTVFAGYCDKMVVLRRRVGFLFSGRWLAGIVIALVALRFGWIEFHHPPHFNEITLAYGSDAVFYGSPQVDHKGVRFTFVKNSPHGDGLFLYDITTGQQRLLREKNRLEHQHDPHDTPDIVAWPWSPDDSSFIYSVSGSLFVSSPDTTQPPMQFVVDTNTSTNLVWTDPISEVVWLNPTEFAWVAWETNLCCAQKQMDGQWQQRLVSSRPSNFSSLAAINDESVAWLENNIICQINVNKGEPDRHASLAAAKNYPTAPLTNGLALWLDASTLKLPDQSPVTHLLDLSPSKNDALNNGNAPIYNGTNNPLALNGKGTIHFSSNGSETNSTGLATHAVSDITGAAPRSVFVVMRRDNTKSSMMIGMGDSRGKGTMFSIEQTNSLFLPTGWRGADNRIRGASTSWNILEALYDGTTEIGYLNGVLKGTAANSLNTISKVVELGARTAGPNGKNAKGADGDFAELLIYNRLLSDAERQKVEDYLSAKWFAHPINRPAANSFAWLDPKIAGLTDLSFSKDTGMFLLTGTDGKGEVLSRFDQNGSDPVRIAQGGPFQTAQRLSSTDYAYLMHTPKKSFIAITDSAGQEKSRLLERTDTRWFQFLPGQQKLLMLGIVSNEPSAGIWEYDINSKKTTSLVSYSDFPSDYAKNILPIDKTLALPSGTNLTYSIFRPANFDPHKKYPLVIGDTEFTVAVNGVHGRQWVPCLAAGGAYVVIIERKRWFTGIEDWGKNVSAVMDTLKKEIRFDADQVYLFGSSSEATYIAQFAVKSPQPWKGIIFLNVWQLPELTGAPALQQRPKILLCNGGEIAEGQLKEYQQKALREGFPLKYIIHQGEGHHIVGNIAQLERTKAIMDFVFKE